MFVVKHYGARVQDFRQGIIKGCNEEKCKDGHVDTTQKVATNYSHWTLYATDKILSRQNKSYKTVILENSYFSKIGWILLIEMDLISGDRKSGRMVEIEPSAKEKNTFVWFSHFFFLFFFWHLVVGGGCDNNNIMKNEKKKTTTTKNTQQEKEEKKRNWLLFCIFW